MDSSSRPTNTTILTRSSGRRDDDRRSPPLVCLRRLPTAVIVVIFGPPGAGKTTITARVRARLAERGVRVRTGHSDDFSRRTYERLAERVADAPDRGHAGRRDVLPAEVADDGTCTAVSDTGTPPRRSKRHQP
ncbi:hypothetical protein NJ7G_3873 [Natrinema sp. J7-2]|nr:MULTISPECIES: ATP-binding protein [unclassified Natrinema]AFO59089.1 hypothetical protein NJ7G_3873 [Natrinema sp. J7-2]